jgi:hypothetical protein
MPPEKVDDEASRQQANAAATIAAGAAAADADAGTAAATPVRPTLAAPASSLAEALKIPAFAGGSSSSGGGNVTARERAYIGALAAYLALDDPTVADPASRLQKYADELRDEVYAPYGLEDANAGILYGLALLAVGYYDEAEPAKGWPRLMEAGQIEEAMALLEPDSPGCARHTQGAMFT